MKAPGFVKRGLIVSLILAMCSTSTRAQTVDAPNAASTQPFVSSQPDVPYLPKPELRAADWIVEHDPVTPGASAEAKTLLHFLYSISGKHTLVGQHNYPGQQEVFTDAAAKIYGKTPALYGTDWGFAKPGDKDTAYMRRDVVKELIKQYHNGSIIAICWHEVRPTEDEPVTFMGSVRKKITDEEFEQVLTPGSPLNKHWCAQVDVIAEYLKQLQDAHVPILWRPYHEINGNGWFWWNGKRGEHGTKILYRQLFDRLVNFHKINNLIWVWNPDQPTSPDKQFVDFFPGHDCVDVLALDDYAVFQQNFYDDLNALSDGKVMAISECGNNMPAIEVYKTQPKWTYFMRWAFGTATPTSRPSTRPTTRRGPPPLDPEAAKKMVGDERMFSLEDAEYWKARAAAGLSATPDAPNK